MKEDIHSMNWKLYLSTRFHNPAALLAWLIILHDPFFYYDNGKLFTTISTGLHEGNQ